MFSVGCCETNWSWTKKPVTKSCLHMTISVFYANTFSLQFNGTVIINLNNETISLPKNANLKTATLKLNTLSIKAKKNEFLLWGPRNVYFFEKQLRIKQGINSRNQLWKKRSNLAWKIFSAYFEALLKYRRMAFSF